MDDRGVNNDHLRFLSQNYFQHFICVIVEGLLGPDHVYPGFAVRELKKDHFFWSQRDDDVSPLKKKEHLANEILVPVRERSFLH